MKSLDFLVVGALGACSHLQMPAVGFMAYGPNLAYVIDNDRNGIPERKIMYLVNSGTVQGATVSWLRIIDEYDMDQDGKVEMVVMASYIRNSNGRWLLQDTMIKKDEPTPFP